MDTVYIFSRSGDYLALLKYSLRICGGLKSRRVISSEDLCAVWRSRSKNEMRKRVEAALTDITPNELLSALCAYTEETSLALSQKTAAIDITKDVEQLRYEITL